MPSCCWVCPVQCPPADRKPVALVYLNGSASGSCEWMGSWAEHRVSVQCDAEAARSLVQHLKAGGHSAAGLTAFSGYDAPLRWGEAVPLCFLGGATATKAKVVVLSHGPASTGERAARKQPPAWASVEW